MREIVVKISSGAEAVWTLEQLASLATIAAGATAIIAMIVATLQYVASSRAQSRAHLHSIFRDYLAIRMQAPDPNDREDPNVVGYRYYAMEEAYHWISKHSWWRPILHMSSDEKAAWLATIDHHIKPDRNKAGHLYFHKNRNIFGAKFRAYCDEALGDLSPEKQEELKAQAAARLSTPAKPAARRKPAAPKDRAAKK